MNKRIDLTKLGGYPLAQEDLDWLQQSYRGAFAAMADLIGDKVIIAGMAESGGTVSAGWISMGSELVPFAGGAIGAGQFIIEETKTSLTFQDGITKEVIIERVARFSTPGVYNYADLKRIGTLKNLFTAGMIIIWSGAVNAVPTGWALCDGTNGTPNLSGKFIVGYDAADVDYNTIGKPGGEKRHTLTIDEMPPHNHSMVNSNSDNGSGKPATGNDTAEGAALITSSTGGGQAHENRPPYYTLAYIIKK